MEEDSNWQVSNQNKKSGNNRFFRQIIIFLIFLIVIGIIALVRNIYI